MYEWRLIKGLFEVVEEVVCIFVKEIVERGFYGVVGSGVRGLLFLER